MTIPTFTQHRVSNDDGEYTAEAQQYNDQLNQYLQDNLSPDGFVAPPRSTNDINEISNPSNVNAMPNGTIWYDSDTDEFKGKIDGNVRVFQLV